MARPADDVTDDWRGRPTWAVRCPVCRERYFWVTPWGWCVPCALRRLGHVQTEAGPWLGEPLGLELRPDDHARYLQVRAARARRWAILGKCRRVVFHHLPSV